MDQIPHTLPSGVELRPYTGDQDLAALVTIFNAAESADGSRAVLSLAAQRAQYASLVNCDPLHDVIIAYAGSEPIAYGRIQWSDLADGTRAYTHFLKIVGPWRAKGVEDALVAWLMDRAKALSAQQPTTRPEVLQTFAFAGATYVTSVLEACGYRIVRAEVDMSRDLRAPIEVPPLPAGLELRAPAPDELRRVWEVMNLAFAEAPDHQEPSEEDFAAWQRGAFFQPEYWQIVWSGSEPVAMVLGYVNPAEAEVGDVRRGYTEGICVHPAWRRRGLASALLARSMAMFRERGMDEAALGVDIANETGALALYERSGFKTLKRLDYWQRPLGKHS